MNRELWVLLVHDREEAFWSLEPALKNLGIQTQRAHTCSEARAALRGLHSSGLILTATTLPDGIWADVLDLASMHGRAIPVIVVSHSVDIDLYLTTLESGASDFIVPPFSAADLAYLLDTAIRKGRAASA